MNRINRNWYSGMTTTEDWWAVWLGMILFLAGLVSVSGYDMVGWMAKVQTWSEFSPGNVLQAAGSAYANWSPFASFAMTYLVFTSLVCLGAAAMRLKPEALFSGMDCVIHHYLGGLDHWL